MINPGSTMTVCDLTNRHCKPCEGGIPPLSASEARALLQGLDESWSLSADAKSIHRHIPFKTYAKTAHFVNMLIWIADREMHHPEIKFGYGYCEITYSTHAIDGLSENDFICAAKIDQLLRL